MYFFYLPNFYLPLLLFFLALFPTLQTKNEPIKLFIGEIQGEADQSPYLNQLVETEGIVTGFHQYENANGRIYYTLFIQEPIDHTDNNPLSSDGIPLFLGSKRPQLELGDFIQLSGTVIEYYGLTEITDLSLHYISSNHPLPPTQKLHPPYTDLEKWEGMRVSTPAATVIAPTHSGCGVGISENGTPSYLLSETTQPTQSITLLFPTNKECTSWPQAKVGDLLDEISGPLTFQFDQYRIILQQQPIHTIIPLSPIQSPAPRQEGEIEIVSLNLHNLFDTKSDTGELFEPVLSEEALTIRIEKLTKAIATSLNCPTLIALQEIENRPLLEQLVTNIESSCAFRYTITHQESNDARGIDLALLSDPSVIIVNHQLIQGCTSLETGLGSDAEICPATNRLFSRPPFSITTKINGRSLDLILIHLKSKRGGIEETAAWRIAQAEFVTSLLHNQTNPFALLGDFNDLPQSATLRIFYNAMLQQPPPISQIPIFTYIFDGQYQQIDYILLPQIILAQNRPHLYIHHLNAEYPDSWNLEEESPYDLFRFSDHDPISVRLQWDDAKMNTNILSTEKPIPQSTPPTTSTLYPTPTTSTSTPTPTTEIIPKQLIETKKSLSNDQPNLLSAIACLISLIATTLLGRVARLYKRN